MAGVVGQIGRRIPTLDVSAEPAEHMPGARSSRIDRKISGIGPRSRALQ